jgi:enoyl-CoA hydratase
MKLEQLRFVVEDGIATVTFDRPPVNALNRQGRDEITRAFDAISDRDDVRVAIFTGAGNVFCAGADIKERVGLVQEPGDYLRHNRQTRETFLSIMDCAKPVIAAVNGPAIGAGAALMLACDIMLASDNAYFSMPEIDVGLSGGQRLLTEHFSRSRARRIFLTAQKVPAAELYRLGVIEACVPRDKLLDEAMQIAREIAAKSPLAVKWAKKAFNMVQHLPYRIAYPYEQSITADLANAEDTREAQRAFLEKRKPKFKGR